MWPVTSEHGLRSENHLDDFPSFVFRRQSALVHSERWLWDGGDNWFNNNYAINLAEEIFWHDMELLFNQDPGVKCLRSEPIVLQIELWTGQNGTSSDSSEMLSACQWHKQSEVICLSLFLPSINTLKKHTRINTIHLLLDTKPPSFSRLILLFLFVWHLYSFCPFKLLIFFSPSLCNKPRFDVIS